MTSKLQAKVDAVNRANECANNLHKSLYEHFQQLVGEKILKKDGSILDKYRSFLPKVENPFRFWKYDSTSIFGFSVDVVEKYDEPKTGCCYHEVFISMGDISEGKLTNIRTPITNRRTDHSCAEVIALQRQYASAQAFAEQAQYLADLAEQKLSPFDGLSS